MGEIEINRAYKPAVALDQAPILKGEWTRRAQNIDAGVSRTCGIGEMTSISIYRISNGFKDAAVLARIDDIGWKKNLKTPQLGKLECNIALNLIK